MNQRKCSCDFGIRPPAIGAMWPIKIRKAGTEHRLSIIHIWWGQDFFSEKLNVQTPHEGFSSTSMLDFDRLEWNYECKSVKIFGFVLCCSWVFAFELSRHTFWLDELPFLIYVLRCSFPITVNCQVQVVNWFSHDSDCPWPFFSFCTSNNFSLLLVPGMCEMFAQQIQTLWCHWKQWVSFSGFHKWGYPRNGWLMMENPNLKWMITRGSHILGHPLFHDPRARHPDGGSGIQDQEGSSSEPAPTSASPSTSTTCTFTPQRLDCKLLVRSIIGTKQIPGLNDICVGYLLSLGVLLPRSRFEANIRKLLLLWTLMDPDRLPSLCKCKNIPMFMD